MEAFDFLVTAVVPVQVPFPSEVLIKDTLQGLSLLVGVSQYAPRKAVEVICRQRSLAVVVQEQQVQVDAALNPAEVPGGHSPVWYVELHGIHVVLPRRDCTSASRP